MQWRKAIEMPELFSNAINKKEIGFISEPLESGAGYHILMLLIKKVHLFNMKINGCQDTSY